MADTSATLRQFNTVPTEVAVAELAHVCTSEVWACTVAAGRPFGTVADVLAASDTATAALTHADLAAALAGHAVIGEPRDDDPRSRSEQAGVAGVEADIAALLRDGNRVYQERFGYVFLIRAAGRGPAEILTALSDRLDNDPEAEAAVVRTELAEINRLRLAELFETESSGTEPDEGEP